jgi:hypothetical protein
MRFLLSTLLLLSLSFFAGEINAQISRGGTPYQWETKSELPLELVRLPEVNLEELAAEDAINDKYKDVPYRFGANIAVDLDNVNDGVWTELENGDGIWRLGIQSEGAISINFIFDQYYLPDGGKVFVYSKDKSQMIGSFTNENASKINSLGVGLIFSDEIIIEYYEPAAVRGEGYLHINTVTHGYREVLRDPNREEKGPFGNSGPCNINVNCPVGLPFDIQKRSVALIVTTGGNSVCSGAMVNNVAQDGTPYFLTARHCGPNAADNWVFYFNHETSGCAGSNGPIDQSVSGGSLLSANQESDFALLELNSTPPASYNVCYSGWDATDMESTVTSAYGIHHPSGDVKKICFEEDAPYHDAINSFVNEVWYIDEWEDGVTEGGSSGSPLFNQNGLIIGQLAGGAAACSGTTNNGLFDYYGRMGVSWSFGDTETNAIRFWLDPGNTGTLIVPNSCNSELPEINASLGAINGIPENSCNLVSFTPTVNVINTGSQTITTLELEVTFNGNTETIDWSGSIESLSNNAVTLSELTSIEGNNVLEINILTVNGEEDTEEAGNSANRQFIGFANAATYNLFINLDNFPQETTWEITDAFNVVVTSGGPYSGADDPVNETICLGDGCYEFTLFDSANDGICCGWGFGEYELTDQDGSVIASGGQFGAQESTSFCSFLNTVEARSSIISVFPNPVRGILNIEATDTSLQSATIFDISGKLVAQKRSTDTKITFNTNVFPAGLYVVEIVDANGVTNRRKVVIAKD